MGCVACSREGGDTYINVEEGVNCTAKYEISKFRCRIAGSVLGDRVMNLIRGIWIETSGTDGIAHTSEIVDDGSRTIIHTHPTILRVNPENGKMCTMLCDMMSPPSSTDYLKFLKPAEQQCHTTLVATEAGVWEYVRGVDTLPDDPKIVASIVMYYHVLRCSFIQACPPFRNTYSYNENALANEYCKYASELNPTALVAGTNLLTPAMKTIKGKNYFTVWYHSYPGLEL